MFPTSDAVVLLLEDSSPPHLLQKVAELEACSLFLHIRSLILGIAKIWPSPLSLTLTLELKPPVALCNWGWD